MRAALSRPSIGHEGLKSGDSGTMDDKLAASLTTVKPALDPTTKWAPERVSVLPIIELSVLAIFATLPLFLADYLTVFFTRVLILSLLAISFDLVWGYAGILSFGQSLFYGTAAYSVALMARDLGITSIFIVLPAALLIELVLSYLIACFLLLGRRQPTVIFVALGTSRVLMQRTDWPADGITWAARMAFRRSLR